MSKIPSDEILDSLYKLRIRESDQLKSVLELFEFIRRNRIPIFKIEDDGEEEYRSETLFTKL